MTPKFKLSTLKATVYDVTYRCHSCRINLLRRATFSQATDVLVEADVAARAPKCPSCKKKTSYYWAASWADDPRGKP